MWRKPPSGTVREQLDKRQKREADLRPAHVVRPGPGFGSYVVHDTHDPSRERIVSAGALGRSFRPGEVVMVGSNTGLGGEVIVSAAPHGKRGAAQFAFGSVTGVERDTVGITKADPNTLPAGAIATPVTFTGFGFRETPLDTFRAVRPYDAATQTYPTDPLITLGTPTWTSVTEVEIPVTVSGTAPAGYEIRLEVTRT